MGIGTAIGIGAGVAGSIGGAAIAGHSAGKAAQTQADAATKAAQLQKESADQALAFQKEQFDYQKGVQAPWIQSGTEALSKLNTFAPFQAPGADFTQDPGYQFRVTQGLKAIQNSAAARGGVLAGGTLKGITEYGQGAASDEYQNVYARRFNEYQNQLGQLQSRAGIGQSATNAVTGAAGTTGSNVASTLLASGNAQGQGALNAGAARASGYAAGGNIYGAIPGQISGDVNQWLTYQQLMKMFPQNGLTNPGTLPIYPGTGATDPLMRYPTV